MLTKYTGKKMPAESTLRKCYVDNKMNNIKTLKNIQT